METSRTIASPEILAIPSVWEAKDGSTLYLIEVAWRGAEGHSISAEEKAELSWSVSRRYREFDALYLHLSKICPDLPNMPPKVMVANRSAAVIEQRRLLLQTFLRECAQYKAVANDRIWCAFLEVPEHIDANRPDAHFLIPSLRLPYELVERSISDISVFSITASHACVEDGIVLVAFEDPHVLSRTDSRIGNALAGKKSQTLPLGALSLWQFSDGKHQMVGHLTFNHRVTCMAFEPTERLLFIGLSNGHIKMYFVDDEWQQLPALLHDVVGHSTAVRDIVLVPAGRLISIGKQKKSVHLFVTGSKNTMPNVSVPFASCPSQVVWAGQQHDESKALIGMTCGTILVCDVSFECDGCVVIAHQINAHKQSIRAMYFPEEQHLFTGGSDRRVGVWDMRKVEQTTHCGWLMGPPTGTVTAVHYIADYKQVVAGYDTGMLILWDAQRGSMWHGWQGHATRIVYLHYDSKTAILTSAARADVKQWHFPDSYVSEAVQTSKTQHTAAALPPAQSSQSSQSSPPASDGSPHAESVFSEGSNPHSLLYSPFAESDHFIPHIDIL